MFVNQMISLNIFVNTLILFLLLLILTDAGFAMMTDTSTWPSYLQLLSYLLYVHNIGTIVQW